MVGIYIIGNIFIGYGRKKTFMTNCMVNLRASSIRVKLVISDDDK